jgi:ERCC4-related helicase
VIVDQGESVVVRFEHGVEVCLARDLEPGNDLRIAIDGGEMARPLEAVARAQALAIRSTNDQWGVFSRSRIELLPHQLWVCRKVRETWPTRWLVADDVGLGKTIEAGLILLPLISAGLVRRLLVLAPANLVGQWQHRLRDMFDIRLQRYVRESDDPKGDFWAAASMVVASLHTLRLDNRGQRHRLLEAEPWDMLIVDEAHHLNAEEQKGATLAYELVQDLQERGRVNSALFFTGTPHRGKDYGFLSLMKLVRSDLFDPDRPLVEQAPQLKEAMIRNNKASATDLEGGRLFTPVSAESRTFSYSTEEQDFYDRLSEFILTGKAYAAKLTGRRQSSVMLVLITMQKLAASSIAAIRRTLRLRDERLDKEVRAQEKILNQVAELREAGNPDSADELSELEERLAAEEMITLMEDERVGLQELLHLAEMVGNESRIQRIVETIQNDFQGESVLLFTEYKATQSLMLSALHAAFGDGGSAFINGDERALGVRRADGTQTDLSMPRADAADGFNDGRYRFLVSTEAAGEGIDLQENCAILIHVDLPWNPMRLHQRVGRLSRYGQSRPVRALTIRNPDTVESRIWDKLNEKIARIQLALSSVMEEPEDLLELVLGMASTTSFDELFAEGGSVKLENLSGWFDSKAATFGGKEAIDAVREIVGNVQRFDFGQVGADLPRADLPDIKPFFLNALAMNRKRVNESDCGISFNTPDAWCEVDFAVMQRYSELTFDRSVRGPEAASRVVGVGHRAFEQALRQSLLLDSRIATVRGLRQPLYIFSIFDQVTSTGSQVRRIVVGLEPTAEGKDPNLLRDWEALRLLNGTKPRRRQDERSESIKLTPDGQAQSLVEMERFLASKLDAVTPDYHVPSIEPEMILLPEKA